MPSNNVPITRRSLGAASLMTALLGRAPFAQPAGALRTAATSGPRPPAGLDMQLTVNGQTHKLTLDAPRF